MTDTGPHDPRDAIAAFMLNVYHRGLTTIAGGNISVRDDAGGLWITPSGLDKGNLDPGDIVRLDSEGKPIGPGRASSDASFHLEVYRRRPDLNAIVHAHAPALVAFSIRHEVPDTAVLPEAAGPCGPVALLPCAGTGGARLADGATCAVVQNHGVMTTGTGLAEAFHRLETLETTARIIACSRALGPLQRPAAPAPPPPPHEQVAHGDEPARLELCVFVRRAYFRRLITSHLGSFSARLDGNRFVMSPQGTYLAGLEPEWLVHPSPLHEAIYAAHPKVRAVFVGAPVNATAFSVTRRPFESRTTPESHLLLGDVPAVPYEQVTGDPRRLARIVSADRPAALLRNVGVLVLGETVRSAYERLEALEATAESLILAGNRGGVIPLSDEAIGALGKPPS